jgi:hypothetical protein
VWLVHACGNTAVYPNGDDPGGTDTASPATVPHADCDHIQPHADR